MESSGQESKKALHGILAQVGGVAITVVVAALLASIWDGAILVYKRGAAPQVWSEFEERIETDPDGKVIEPGFYRFTVRNPGYFPINDVYLDIPHTGDCCCQTHQVKPTTTAGTSYEDIEDGGDCKIVVKPYSCKLDGGEQFSVTLRVFKPGWELGRVVCIYDGNKKAFKSDNPPSFPYYTPFRWNWLFNVGILAAMFYWAFRYHTKTLRNHHHVVQGIRIANDAAQELLKAKCEERIQVEVAQKTNEALINFMTKFKQSSLQSNGQSLDATPFEDLIAEETSPTTIGPT